MDVGEISPVVETPFGFHIIKVTDRKKGRVLSLAETRDGIRYLLRDRKNMNLQNDFCDELRAEANIVYPPGKAPADESGTAEDGPNIIPLDARQDRE
jgi:parvulin-like peptidyl-prolyl isomerase